MWCYHTALSDIGTWYFTNFHVWILLSSLHLRIFLFSAPVNGKTRSRDILWEMIYSSDRMKRKIKNEMAAERRSDASSQSAQIECVHKSGIIIIIIKRIVFHSMWPRRSRFIFILFGFSLAFSYLLSAWRINERKCTQKFIRKENTLKKGILKKRANGKKYGRNEHRLFAGEGRTKKRKSRIRRESRGKQRKLLFIYFSCLTAKLEPKMSENSDWCRSLYGSVIAMSP